MSSGHIKKRVDKRDKYRVLLTEVLPYEVPLWFTNDYYHDACTIGNHFNSRQPLGKMLQVHGSNQEFHVPFSYRVIRDEGGIRELSIMHPAVQLSVCEFYSKYSEVILHFCEKSEYSLRAPTSVACRFYESSSGDSTPTGVEEENAEKSYCSSFFKYSHFAFLYKFFESYSYHSLEKRYRCLCQVDVAKCFDSIYTHSISWAVKSKLFAKMNRKSYSFDSHFDRLMQKTNYQETNGILIGPEISRIFAEIIFQEIDSQLVNNLRNDKNHNALFVHKDYEFRRYVDDYFIFSSKKEITDAVVAELSCILADYKMHLNNQKQQYHIRPFVSPISLCKQALSREINRIFLNRFTNKDDKRLRKTHSPSHVANKYIIDIKCVVEHFDTSYKSISNYLLAIYTRKISDVLSKFDFESDDEDALTFMLLADLDVVFFCYCMDIRVRPTDWVAKFIQKVLFYTQGLSAENIYLIKKKIFDSGRQAIEIFRNISEKISFVEIQNILLALSLLGSDFTFQESYLIKLLKDLLDIEFQSQQCGYFMWVSFMIYIRDSTSHKSLRKSLIDCAVSRFNTDQHSLQSTELFLFFMDFMSCPWVEKSYKVNVLGIIRKQYTELPQRATKVNAFIHLFKGQRFFVDWNDDAWVAARLKKKKYSFAYR